MQMSEDRVAKIDGPMTFGYGIDATDSAYKNQWRGTNVCHAKGPAITIMVDRSSPLAWKKSPRREALFDFAIGSSEMHMVLHLGSGNNRGILMWC
jgi:hypothetical protein